MLLLVSRPNGSHALPANVYWQNEYMLCVWPPSLQHAHREFKIVPATSGQIDLRSPSQLDGWKIAVCKEWVNYIDISLWYTVSHRSQHARPLHSLEHYIYAQTRWQTFEMALLRIQYFWVCSHKRTESATGANCLRRNRHLISIFEMILDSRCQSI